MGKKKEHHEEHVDETWLIPYADMLTLLLALFIVMFAMSKVDKEKFQKISEQFNVVFSGGAGVMDNNGSSNVPLPVPKSESSSSTESESASNTEIEDNKMNEIKRKLEEEVEKRGYANKVKIDINQEGLYIAIQDVILFNSGDANVLKEVSPLLLQISEMLKGLGNSIKFVGHTDNVPISTKNFRSNWDLSATRAINVMNFMVNTGGLSPDRVSIEAYGEYKPKFDNSTQEGRAKNRRVEIFVVRQYPSNTK